MALSETQRREYGAGIRRIRESRNWTRQRLADESDVPVGTLRDIEFGAVPHPETLSKLFAALDVEHTTFGLMSRWMADQIAALVIVAQQVPSDRLPETFGAIVTVLGRAARGLDLGLADTPQPPDTDGSHRRSSTHG